MKLYLIVYLCLILSSTISAQQRIKVACVGNSITYGSALFDRTTQSYPAQLQRMLGDNYEVRNFGKPGATLLNKGHRPYTQQEEFQKAKDFAGDIVVIHLGINDTDPRNWPNYRDSFVKEYLALIDTFRVVNPKTRIIIARITPIADRHPRFLSGTRDWHEEIQQSIEAVARTAEVQLIDFHKLLYPYPYMLPDAVHPTAEGALMMAKNVYSAITGNFGGLAMSSIYTDDMVLQRNTPLNIYGMADAGELVTVSIGGQKVITCTKLNGEWLARLLPLKAGEVYTLTISTLKRKLCYNNVLAGEVWLCSGQSNMEFMLKDASTAKIDIPSVSDNQIRLYRMQARWRTNAVEWNASVLDSLNLLHYYKPTKWDICTTETAANFSAIAYYFGKMLRDSLQVPVGLICNAVGGSPTESWIERGTLEHEFPAILKDWTKNDFIQEWVRERAALNIKKSTHQFQRHPYEPCYLYESGILPLKQFPIKGVIWYQGESNAHNKEAHEKLFKLLVASWRKNWKNDELPFYYVQLSSLDRPSWPWFRDSQRRLMDVLPQTGMAVSSDCGDSLDVHPTMKKPVGQRLARWALNKTYQHKSVVSSGPLFRSAYFNGESVYVAFDYGQGLSSLDGKVLRTFEVAETEGLYYPAKAEIIGPGKLKISSEQVEHPHYVRYGWQPFTRSNLVNESGLPASTFCVAAPKPFVRNIRLREMSGSPQQERGLELGVSACYAGILGGHLIMAGGSNFPDNLAFQGGEKKYYQGIYATDFYADSVYSWRKVGELPVSAAYGVSVSTVDGLIFVGGMNGKGSLTTVYSLRWQPNGKKIKIEQLPSLPYALDNMTGAMVGNQLFVAGGNKDGKPSNSLLCLNIERLAEGWRELPSFPGNTRVQAVSTGQYRQGEICFYIWGGFSPDTKNKPATLSVDGYCYSPSSQEWTEIATPFVEGDGTISLGGGTSFALGDRLILCMGGVHKDIFLSALQEPIKEYLSHPVEWHQYNKKIMVYHTELNQWQELIATSNTARAGAALVGDGNTLLSIGGELKPGIRTPKIFKIIID